MQDAGSGAKTADAASQVTLQLVDGKFRDHRWQGGRWTLDSFKDGTGKMDWDKVILTVQAKPAVADDDDDEKMSRELHAVIV